MAVKYTPPEGYKPPKQAGTKTAIGKGNRPAPQREGESDADFQRRSAQWMKTYNERGGVKLADMNQGQLNKFVSSGPAQRAQRVTDRLTTAMSKTKPPAPPGSPDMSAQNPSAPKPPKPPTTPREPREPRGAGMTATGGSPQGTGGFGGSVGALGRMPGRRARRRMRRMAGRA